jgi:hypothetical protein
MLLARAPAFGVVRALAAQPTFARHATEKVQGVVT